MRNLEKKKDDNAKLPEEIIPGKGLLGRRALLRGALLSAGAAAASVGIAQADDSVGANAPEWMKTPGKPFSAYGSPSKSESTEGAEASSSGTLYRCGES